MGQVIKYGQVYGPIVSIEYPVAASEVFKHLGGAFVQWDTNNRIIIAVAGVTDIIGWAFTGDFYGIFDSRSDEGSSKYL